LSADEASKNPSTALVRAPAPRIDADVGLQHLWLALRQRLWRTLAIVAAGPGMPTLEVANNLAKISWWYTGQPSGVVDLRDASMRLLEHHLRLMTTHTAGEERVFLALRSIDENATAVPIAMAADAAVLCVELGKTEIRAAKKALSAIGSDRFMGTVLVKPNGAVGRSV
jgi:hypothetical protein